jgi:hypothetical protein
MPSFAPLGVVRAPTSTAPPLSRWRSPLPPLRAQYVGGDFLILASALPWSCALVTVGCTVLQLKHLNLAMSHFDASQVPPTGGSCLGVAYAITAQAQPVQPSLCARWATLGTRLAHCVALVHR